MLKYRVVKNVKIFIALFALAQRRKIDLILGCNQVKIFSYIFLLCNVDFDIHLKNLKVSILTSTNKNKQNGCNKGLNKHPESGTAATTDTVR